MRHLSCFVYVFAVTLGMALLALADAPPPWGDLSVINDATQKGPHSLPNPGDEIFTPKTSPMAAIDKTGRPFTALAAMQEPAFAGIVAPNKPTGDSYVIKFPNVERGGACVFDGNARYFVDHGGVLTYQISAQCKDLKRGYNFMVCMLDDQLHCAEAPWWNFRGRTYAVTAQGIVVNQATTYPWDDAAHAPEKLQKISADLLRFKDTYNNPNAPNVLHRRVISCRNYQPEQKKYGIAEIITGCLISSLCNADKTPDLSAIHDGDAIDWNSPLGSYIKQQQKITDVSNSVCWLRTQ